MNKTAPDLTADTDYPAVKVLTFTPAPSIDRTYSLSALRPGEVNRALISRSTLGGKGVNVAGTLTAGGECARAVLPLDPALIPTSVPAHLDIIEVRGAGRTNVILIEDRGATTNVNDKAAPMSLEDWRRLHGHVLGEARARAARWLVLGGALPEVDGRPAPLELLADAAQQDGIRVALDVAGAELRRLLLDGLRPDLVKPNATELSDATDHRIADVDDAVTAALRLKDMGASAVLASLGERGALYVDARNVLACAAPQVPVVDTTGAGDALLAGFLSGIGDGGPVGIRLGLRRGVNWGALTVQSASPVASSLRDDHPLAVRKPATAVALGWREIRSVRTCRPR